MADLIRAELEALIAAYDEHGGMWPDQDVQALFAAVERARATLAAEPPAPAEPDTDAVLALAAIIRRVDGSNSLGAAALAEAILAHPKVASVFQPPDPAPADHVPDAGNVVAADPSDFQTFQGIALDMVESLRPIVLPEILGVLRRAIKQPPAPAPAADGEHEELAQWLERIGDDYDDLYRPPSALIRPKLARAAALLREARPQPVPVADRPWERPGWCDAEGRCWFGAPVAGAVDAGWILRKPSERLSHQAVSLPHWAIPQPPHANTTHPTPTEPPTDD